MALYLHVEYKQRFEKILLSSTSLTIKDQNLTFNNEKTKTTNQLFEVIFELAITIEKNISDDEKSIKVCFIRLLKHFICINSRSYKDCK